MRSEQFRKVDWRFQVDGQLFMRTSPWFRLRLSNIEVAALNAGVVDEHVDAGKFECGPIKEGDSGGRVGEIADPRVQGGINPTGFVKLVTASPQTMTLLPARRKRSARARPMPEAPPVIKMVFESRRMANIGAGEGEVAKSRRVVR